MRVLTGKILKEQGEKITELETNVATVSCFINAK